MLDDKKSREEEAFGLVMGKVFCLMRFLCPRLFGRDQDKDDFYQDKKALTVPKSNEGAFSMTAKISCMIVILPLLVFLAWVAAMLNKAAYP